MSINVKCSCGKQLAAPERLAGKRAKCPGCGTVLPIPDQPPEPEPADPSELDLLEDDDPIEPATPNRPETPTAPASGGDADSEPGGQKSSRFTAGSYADVVRQTADKRAARAKTKRWTLFQLHGMDVTVPRLLVPIVLITALVVWWFTGPADEADVNTVTSVHVVHAMQGLEVRESYSLLTGQGDRSLGMKGPKLKNQPTPSGASTAPAGTTGARQNVAYALGGGDQLFVVRPDKAGSHIYADMEIAQHLIEAHTPKDKYKLQIREREFEVKPVGGGAALKPKLLFIEFNQPITLDIGGADTIVYHPLLPPGVPPTQRDVTRQYGGVARGEVNYGGENGVTGDVEFQSYHYLSGGAPNVKGLGANGQLQLNRDGINVAYQYNGGTMNVTPGAGTTAWWSKREQLKTPSWHPWVHFRVGLLFEPKTTASAWQVLYAGKHVATIERPAGSKPPASVASAGGQSGGSQKQNQKQNKSKLNPINAPSTYLGMLNKARDKAKNTVAMSNMRQLGIAMQTYMQSRGTWPDELEQLKSEIGEDAYEQMITHPLTKEKPGYIYEKPAPGDDPATTPVLWEARSGYKYLDGAILYADGHIEGG